MFHTVKNWLNGLAGLFFPSFCIECRRVIPDRPGTWLCERCLAGVRMPEGGTCDSCGQYLGPSALGKPSCANCRDRDFSFRAVHALGRYTHPLKRWIRVMKFNHKPVIGYTLGRELGKELVPSSLDPPPDVITGIPLTPYREAKRSFNQAYLIAAGVRDTTGLPFLPDCPVKTKRTTPQVRLSRHERLNNLSTDTFRVPDASAVRDRNVLLVDDVMTTGSTLDTAGRALLDSGADSVRAAVLGR